MAYHGRASSVHVSGEPVRRPQGIVRAPDGQYLLHPSRQLDYELELGFWVGPGNPAGSPIDIDGAEASIFGVVLLNDWSARDVQAAEALPLGPFLGKNFLTTVSPWIITMEALEPFRCALPRAAEDPPALPHLRPVDPQQGFDIQLEAWLQPAGGAQATRLSRSSFRHGHWSMAQMLTHHTEGGCPMRPGDLLGTGTQSGPGEGEQGCLLELSRGGTLPVNLADGSTRTFLEDGDTLVLRACAERKDRARIGFGDCVGTVVAHSEVAAAISDG